MHKNNRTSSKTKTFLTEYFEPEFDNNLHLGLAPLDLSTTAATSKQAAYNQRKNASKEERLRRKRMIAREQAKEVLLNFNTYEGNNEEREEGK